MWRTSTDGNSCSVNSLNGWTRDGEMPAINARGCNVLAETWSGSLSGNGVDNRAMTDCGTLSEMRTVGDAHHGPVNIRSLRMRSAESPGRTKPSQTVWSALRAIHMDSAPSGCWAVNGIGNVPSTKTDVGPTDRCLHSTDSITVQQAKSDKELDEEIQHCDGEEKTLALMTE
ncbi:hypothetical protein UY3_12163 [Chelonia mydas]|uniref:Uncharacterized protein n=1 Tax=Chelonia mydas TaxID=8469 RepID=M7AYV4_CHEMY|nr:hypothetical protein UY3_12163 [Chelonia mydas]